MGLIDSDTGLSYGFGLAFEPAGLGGAGLINPVIDFPDNVVFAGTSNLSALASIPALTNATFIGSGGLTANVIVLAVATATLTGSGALTAVSPAGIAFAGASTLSVSTLARLAALDTLTGAGGLSASANSIIFDLAESFAGAGGLSVSGVDIIYDLVEAFAGTSTLTSSATRLAMFDVAELLAGSGNLSALTKNTLPVTAALNGSGTLSAELVKGFTDTRSLSFTATSDQFLSRLGSASINQQKFTLAFWFKRASAGAAMGLYHASDHAATPSFFTIDFNVLDNVQVNGTVGGVAAVNKITNAAFSDTTSWHHLCVAIDTTQAAANNRVRVYVDNTEITAWATNVNPAQNANLDNNFAQAYGIGAQFAFGAGFTRNYNGLLNDFYYIDGQQLTPSSFITGAPGAAKAYSGTYAGVFDFAELFEDNSSITALGQDSSGEGNDWTLTNMTTANSSTDVPA